MSLLLYAHNAVLRQNCKIYLTLYNLFYSEDTSLSCLAYDISRVALLVSDSCGDTVCI